MPPKHAILGVMLEVLHNSAVNVAFWVVAFQVAFPPQSCYWDLYPRLGKEVKYQEMKERPGRFSRISHLYDYSGELGDPCVYCGIESSGWDHVPPIHFIDRIAADQRHSWRLRMIPACKECNAWLGGILLTSIDERRGLIKRKMVRRYAPSLRVPHWEEVDLGTFSRNLADNIRAHARMAQHVRARLLWPT